MTDESLEGINGAALYLEWLRQTHHDMLEEGRIKPECMPLSVEQMMAWDSGIEACLQIMLHQGSATEEQAKQARQACQISQSPAFQ